MGFLIYPRHYRVPLSYDLTTFQILGQKVKFFVQTMTPKGHYEINWPLDPPKGFALITLSLFRKAKREPKKDFFYVVSTYSTCFWQDWLHCRRLDGEAKHNIVCLEKPGKCHYLPAETVFYILGWGFYPRVWYPKLPKITSPFGYPTRKYPYDSETNPTQPILVDFFG